MDPYTPPPGSLGIFQILTSARSHLTRLTPSRAFTYLQTPHPTTNAPSTVLVDIRPAAQRAAEGQIEGAMIIERNVLEWRFDPRSEARLNCADRYDLRVIVLCQEGYTSSLAAASLQGLGLWNATDVVGGFRAWREAGLPERIEGLGGAGRL